MQTARHWGASNHRTARPFSPSLQTRRRCLWPQHRSRLTTPPQTATTPCSINLPFTTGSKASIAALPKPPTYIHIHVLNLPRAWVWLIPINQTVTSVGIVTKGADFPKSNETVKDFFDRHIASHPVLARRMANARPLHEFTRGGNYSYVMDRFAGDGWLLVGDAARFVDPVFSSGVSVAMESAKRAADAIITALNRNDVRATAFAEYERAMRAGVDIWREFILLYYQLPPLFFDLISAPRTAALNSLASCKATSMIAPRFLFLSKCGKQFGTCMLMPLIRGVHISAQS